MHRPYTVIISHNGDDYKAYKFDEFDTAKEIYLHAKKNNFYAIMLDEYNNILKIED